MALKSVNSLSTRYFPHSHGTIVTPANQSVTVRSDRTNRVLMTSEDTDEIRAIGIISMGSTLVVHRITWFRESPNSQTRVAGTGYDDWFFRHHFGCAVSIATNLDW